MEFSKYNVGTNGHGFWAEAIGPKPEDVGVIHARTPEELAAKVFGQAKNPIASAFDESVSPEARLHYQLAVATAKSEFPKDA